MSLMIDFTGNVVFITGGSRGIGAACAEMFARAGARIAFSYSHNRREAQGTAKRIVANGGECIFFPLDMASASSCRQAVRRVTDAYSRIDVLVNNAGIWERGAADRMTEREWIRTIDINLNGTFRLCRLILPIMKKQRSGKIINISSTAGQRGEPFYSHYAASKGGIISFTKSLAIEAIPFGINVNCVAPGWVSTDMTAHISRNSTRYKEICAGLPRGRFATPEEVAGPVLFLASDLAVNLVGEILNVNGGSVLCG